MNYDVVTCDFVTCWVFGRILGIRCWWSTQKVCFMFLKLNRRIVGVQCRDQETIASDR